MWPYDNIWVRAQHTHGVIPRSIRISSIFFHISGVCLLWKRLWCISFSFCFIFLWIPVEFLDKCLSWKIPASSDSMPLDVHCTMCPCNNSFTTWLNQTSPKEHRGNSKQCFCCTTTSDLQCVVMSVFCKQSDAFVAADTRVWCCIIVATFVLVMQSNCFKQHSCVFHSQILLWAIYKQKSPVSCRKWKKRQHDVNGILRATKVVAKIALRKRPKFALDLNVCWTGRPCHPEKGSMLSRHALKKQTLDVMFLIPWVLTSPAFRMEPRSFPTGWNLNAGMFRSFQVNPAKKWA